MVLYATLYDDDAVKSALNAIKNNNNDGVSSGNSHGHLAKLFAVT